MSPSNANKAQDGVTSQAQASKTEIAELKNGKVIFKQKPMSLEKNSETMQGVVKCREYIEQLFENKEPMFTTFPVEHLPVIAKLAHESDKSLAVLAKHIAKELTPAQEDEDDAFANSPAIPAQVIEAAIKSTLERNNYGLEGPSDTKLPATVCAWRWEVKEQYKDWLPKAVRERAESRKVERKQAKEALRIAFEALPQNERNEIIPAKSLKSSLSDGNVAIPTIVDLTIDDPKLTPTKSKGKGKAHDDENDKPQLKQSAEKKDDPEKPSKEKARLERKAAKEEREKKEKESQNRSRSLMANFIVKAKSKPSNASPSKENATASTSQSDFDRVFKPFVVKKDAVLAPINWFHTNRRNRRSDPSGVIVIDDEEDLEPSHPSFSRQESTDPAQVASMSTQDRLDSVIRSMAGSPIRQKSSLQYKIHHPITVRSVMNQLSEAELAGDDVLVRTLLAQLQDRTIFPAKVLSFHEDLRPGYFGTFTRNSRTICPRRPLAKDMTMVDYAYDSGEEWEEENPNDADDVNDDGEEDEGSESADSDLDNWLVDDDEEEVMGVHAADDLLMDLDTLPTLNKSPPKRKAEEPSRKKLAKKRKVVVPLVPYSKGPCWETVIGHCEADVLKQHRIQLFNDTPCGVDPFSFVSSCTEDYSSATTQPTPPTIVNTSSSSSNLMPPPPPPPTTTKRIVKPKTTFPDALLPELLSKITSMQAPTIPFLVDSIYQDLRSQNVKKNSIEAKVREVSEKCKEKKYWVVKADVLAKHASPCLIPSA